jgi:uncharacterized surface anchored protein
MTDVPFGTYCVAETTTPAHFFTANAQSATINQTTPTVTLTFTDVPKPGAVQVTKTDTKGNALAGAKFKISQNGSQVGTTLTTDANGHVCFTGLTVGTTYQVQETAAPTGYSFDATAKDVTVSTDSSDCSGSPAKVSFTDTPLSTVVVTFSANTNPAVTTATIQCQGLDSQPVSLASPYTQSTLVPGTYNCQIVIDP